MRPVADLPAPSIEAHADGGPRLSVIDADPAVSDGIAGQFLAALLVRLARTPGAGHPVHVAAGLLAALRRLPLEAG
ncbi:MAG: hypothetical protein AB1586_26005 [Pseudomonadota bacterium]|jgi:hypothetical protein